MIPINGRIPHWIAEKKCIFAQDIFIDNRCNCKKSLNKCPGEGSRALITSIFVTAVLKH